MSGPGAPRTYLPNYDEFKAPEYLLARPQPPPKTRTEDAHPNEFAGLGKRAALPPAIQVVAEALPPPSAPQNYRGRGRGGPRGGGRPRGQLQRGAGRFAGGGRPSVVGAWDPPVGSPRREREHRDRDRDDRATGSSSGSSGSRFNGSRGGRDDNSRHAPPQPPNHRQFHQQTAPGPSTWSRHSSSLAATAPSTVRTSSGTPSPSRVVDVSGYSDQTSGQDIRDLFENYGPVERVFFSDTRTAHVEFTYPDDAENSTKLDGSFRLGSRGGLIVRLPAVTNAHETRTASVPQGAAGRSTYQTRVDKRVLRNTVRVTGFADLRKVGSTNRPALKAVFGQFGPIVSVEFEHSTALVAFENFEDARACLALDSTEHDRLGATKLRVAPLGLYPEETYERGVRVSGFSPKAAEDTIEALFTSVGRVYQVNLLDATTANVYFLSPADVPAALKLDGTPGLGSASLAVVPVSRYNERTPASAPAPAPTRVVGAWSDGPSRPAATAAPLPPIASSSQLQPALLPAAPLPAHSASPAHDPPPHQLPPSLHPNLPPRPLPKECTSTLPPITAPRPAVPTPTPTPPPAEPEPEPSAAPSTSPSENDDQLIIEPVIPSSALVDRIPLPPLCRGTDAHLERETFLTRELRKAHRADKIISSSAFVGDELVLHYTMYVESEDEDNGGEPLHEDPGESAAVEELLGVLPAPGVLSQPAPVQKERTPVEEEFAPVEVEPVPVEVEPTRVEADRPEPAVVEQASVVEDEGVSFDQDDVKPVIEQAEVSTEEVDQLEEDEPLAPLPAAAPSPPAVLFPFGMKKFNVLDLDQTQLIVKDFLERYLCAFDESRSTLSKFYTNDAQLTLRIIREPPPRARMACDRFATRFINAPTRASSPAAIALVLRDLPVGLHLLATVKWDASPVELPGGSRTRGALFVSMHGQFEEFLTKVVRDVDRTFVLVPTPQSTSYRIKSDIVVFRHYVPDSWNPINVNPAPWPARAVVAASPPPPPPPPAPAPREESTIAPESVAGPKAYPPPPPHPQNAALEAAAANASSSNTTAAASRPKAVALPASATAPTKTNAPPKASPPVKRSAPISIPVTAPTRKPSPPRIAAPSGPRKRSPPPKRPAPASDSSSAASEDSEDSDVIIIEPKRQDRRPSPARQPIAPRVPPVASRAAPAPDSSTPAASAKSVGKRRATSPAGVPRAAPAAPAKTSRHVPVPLPKPAPAAVPDRPTELSEVREQLRQMTAMIEAMAQVEAAKDPAHDKGKAREIATVVEPTKSKSSKDKSSKDKANKEKTSKDKSRDVTIVEAPLRAANEALLLLGRASSMGHGLQASSNKFRYFFDMGNGSSFIGASSHGGVVQWNPSKQTMENSFASSTAVRVDGMDFSSKKQTLVVGYYPPAKDAAIPAQVVAHRINDNGTLTSTFLPERPHANGGVSAVTIIDGPGKLRFATAGFDKSIHIWNLRKSRSNETTEVSQTTKMFHSSTICGLDASSDGKFLVSGGLDKRLITYNVEVAHPVWCATTDHGIHSVTWVPDKPNLVLVCRTANGSQFAVHDVRSASSSPPATVFGFRYANDPSSPVSLRYHRGSFRPNSQLYLHPDGTAGARAWDLRRPDFGQPLASVRRDTKVLQTLAGDNFLAYSSQRDLTYAEIVR